ncbi:hypothetical protein I302_108306 [Kwoniella bestiolae CBS 10118]|uniref:Uncharacterized protein n=1 Tax=Kwoniella bestiolae CBS 10118 TaxID=1296100 RepID=A0A1B9FW33_9TREE|nr:hypothetical protein I302_07325 [Kwoniella bestiolae CBS 10118]OCF22975.1 hypothetical protein I302_07325 [Kwoniella bestiolae CBS 10118]
MPPKSSNLHHITFHFYKSAVLLSLPSNTSISSLKTQLLPALSPLSSSLPVDLPTSTSDIQLWEDKSLVEGQEGNEREIQLLEEGGKTISQLGWGRWKSLYVSFKSPDGSFSKPVYTIPDVEDEEPDGSEV